MAVISNGTAVLGLGNIGPHASKPVMEGKGILFKRFADIDVFDLEVDTTDNDKFIEAVKLLEPTFGGINLEDIKAPDCFYIEEHLKEQMKIPIFHDDQHGTAIITTAAFLNAMELVNKKMDKVKVVFSGAGAAGIACANLFITMGVRKENILMCDTHGIIHEGRKEGMNPYKEKFAVKTNKRTLEDAMKGADVFVGVSVKDIVTPEMVKSMAHDPIVFALANPDPEISYELATATRSDIIMATGRSDYPNQVNNVLGFPFIFRGALDVRATTINDEMKIAAVRALASIAKEPVTEAVSKAYGGAELSFGPEYIIPKPFDPRALLYVAPAVAKAAIDSGVSTVTHFNINKYKENLEKLLGPARSIMRAIINKAKATKSKIVYPEGEAKKVILAARIVRDEGIAHPILLGSEQKIKDEARALDVDLHGIDVINPQASSNFDRYVEELYLKRKRKGLTRHRAEELMKGPTVFGMMMVGLGDADGLVGGLDKAYPETIRPALKIIKTMDGISKASGLYMMITKNKCLFFADTTVNIMPSAEDLAEIAICSANLVKALDIEPHVAMLSFSNFGSTKHPLTELVSHATRIVKERIPDLMIDGEMQADTAVVPEILLNTYPFSDLKTEANVLIFPDLNSANIAYKLMYRIGGAEAIGPILMGMAKPISVVERSAGVTDIVNMTAITAVEAIWSKKNNS